MCWSGEASAALATVGLAATAYAAYKKEPFPLWISLGYFSLMELLQAFTYSVIDQCALPSNQIATLFGYLHIVFQPFFINIVSLYFVPEQVRKKMMGWALTACFAASILMLMQLYPFEWAGKCEPGTVLCGERLCSVHGNWHIAWEVPLNGLFSSVPFVDFSYIGISEAFPVYVFVGFFLPLLYGSWRFTLYHIVMGPSLAALLTNNNNEWPAVWCLLSIGLLLIVVKSPVRRAMHVKTWWLWPSTWKKGTGKA